MFEETNGFESLDKFQMHRNLSEQSEPTKNLYFFSSSSHSSTMDRHRFLFFSFAFEARANE